jgi:hypothetical protein
MQSKRIFSLLGVAVVAIAVVAALMTSLALAQDNIQAHVHMPLQPIAVDGVGDAESFLADFHVFEGGRAEGTMQWKDRDRQGILRVQNGQVSCVEDGPTFDLLGTLSTGPLNGEPDRIRYVAATVTPLRYTPHFTCTDFPGPYSCDGSMSVSVDPAVYDEFVGVGRLAFDTDLCR